MPAVLRDISTFCILSTKCGILFFAGSLKTNKSQKKKKKRFPGWFVSLNLIIYHRFRLLECLKQARGTTAAAVPFHYPSSESKPNNTLLIL